MQNDNRQRLIKLIHVAKRELSMPDDSYRHLLLQVVGKMSASGLNVQELEAVFEHMKKAGFKVRTKTGQAPKKPSRALAQGHEHKKIRALWLLLNELGVLRDPSERALAAYCRRLTGVEALQWLDGHQTYKLIESLKKWLLRYLPAAVQKLDAQVIWEQLPKDQREHLQWLLIEAGRGTFDPMQAAYEGLRDHLGGNHGK